MRALHYVIVSFASEYNNEINIAGIDVVVNNTIESVEHINRIGTVVAAPSYVKLQEGDKVVCHHNITRINNGMSGNAIRSEFWIKDDLFYVPVSEIFAYKRKADWKAVDPYCFVKPVPVGTEYCNGILLSPEELNKETHKGQKKLTGFMWLPNEELMSQGIDRGDEVIFSEDSEYEFNFPEHGILYKMSTKDVLGVI